MNPFTESTVARPLSEPRRHAANDGVSDGTKPAVEDADPCASVPKPKSSTGRRIVRDARTVRLLRRQARDAIRRREQISASSHIDANKSNKPACLPIATGWSVKCRRSVGAMLGAFLALGASVAWAVNVNSAGAQELETITGIGPKTAQTIVDERTRGGSFESFEDLAERVKGIGPKKAKSLQAAGLTVGAGGSAPKTPVPAVQRKAGK